MSHFQTSCFQYISCLETSQAHFKQCAGGTGVSLTLEAKDVNIKQIIRYRALEFIGCQDRLLKEILDFDALQILVNEDAKECFEKLPESTRRIEGIKLKFSDSCDYVEPVKRDLHGRDAFQCLLDYKQDREYCESLLECCPDHIRCGERMNAVSQSYQSAKDKAQQIVSNMLFCIVNNDPRFREEGIRLQQLRDPYRNAGIPFLRPDKATEERILRRLSLTSTSSLLQRRTRFNEKYRDVRKKLQLKLQQFYATTEWPLASPQRFEEATGKSPAAIVAEQLKSDEESTEASPSAESTIATETTSATSSEEEKPLKSTAVIEEPPKIDLKAKETDKGDNDDASIEKSLEKIVEDANKDVTTTLAPSTTEDAIEFSTERRIAIIKTLLRSASDEELSEIVTLIAEANFNKLAEIEAAKLAEAKKSKTPTGKLDADRVEKIRGAIKQVLKTKKHKPEDTLEKKTLKFEKEDASDLDSKDFARRSLAGAPPGAKPSEAGIEDAANLNETVIHPNVDSTSTEKSTKSSESEETTTKKAEEIKEKVEEQPAEKEPEPEKPEKEEELKENGGEIVEKEVEKAKEADKTDKSDKDEQKEEDRHSGEVSTSNSTAFDRPKGLEDDSKEKPYLKSSEEATTKLPKKEEKSDENSKKNETKEIPEIHNVAELLDSALHSQFVAFGKDSKLKEAKLATLSFASDRTPEKVDRTARKLKETAFNKNGKELKTDDFEQAETGMEKPKVKDIPKSVEFETVTPKSSEVREKLMTVEKEIKAVKDIVVPAPDPATQLKVIDEISKIVNSSGSSESPKKKSVADLPVKPTLESNTTTELPEVTTKDGKLSGTAEKLMSKMVEDMKQKTQNGTDEKETSTKSPAVHDDAKISDEAPSTDDGLLTSASLEVTTPLTPQKSKQGEESTGDMLHSKNVTRTYCKEFASCWETLQIYEEQCEKRFSKDILNHGIEEPEIVQMLLNSSLSKNNIVLKACLKPLDKNAYTTVSDLKCMLIYLSYGLS
ncbi:hypothetical protein WR25_19029 isoform B [Diploscapter pachys]|uniref:Uncharacterized protein n=1 Tax=Diploscapter pachys TaxID=2018661 RepID=A0A2A2JJT9_9BILA|nr:hypothetical protein WR25_19029 isoform B [Diploscapter pachys]